MAEKAKTVTERVVSGRGERADSGLFGHMCIILLVKMKERTKSV